MSKSSKTTQPAAEPAGPTVREHLEYAEKILVLAIEALKPCTDHGDALDGTVGAAMESLLRDANAAIAAVVENTDDAVLDARVEEHEATERERLTGREVDDARATV
ncbi:MAG TPA: hypothetical protein VJN96_19710 [Vicinamibacterales bacterium]|nr:hypothetical protein [Vicinamibacterales bacterium]